MPEIDRRTVLLSSAAAAVFPASAIAELSAPAAVRTADSLGAYDMDPEWFSLGHADPNKAVA